eukprot:gene10337-8273_t
MSIHTDTTRPIRSFKPTPPAINIRSCRIRRAAACHKTPHPHARCIAHAALTPKASESLPPLRLTRVPSDLLDSISSSNTAWLDACFKHPLVEPNSGIQDQGVHKVLSTVLPGAVMLELPLDSGSVMKKQGEATPRETKPVGLLYPAFIQVLLDAWDLLFSDADVSPSAVSEWLSPEVLSRPVVHDALIQLTDCQVDARVGKDILDPFEAVGVYPALDFVTSPRQIVATAELLGYIPGLEYAVAVHCIDAPFKLQEFWVRDMVANFSMQEHDLVRGSLPSLGVLMTGSRGSLPILEVLMTGSRGSLSILGVLMTGSRGSLSILGVLMAGSRGSLPILGVLITGSRGSLSILGVLMTGSRGSLSILATVSGERVAKDRLTHLGGSSPTLNLALKLTMDCIWVEGMLPGVHQKAEQLGKEVNDLQALLPDSFSQWDQTIAAEVGASAGTEEQQASLVATPPIVS